MLKLCVIGNLGSDPKVVKWNEKSFLTFSVGVTNAVKTKENEKKEVTTWVECSMPNSEMFEKYLKKGKKVFVEGSLTYDIWHGDKGEGVNIKCRVHNLFLL